MKDRIILFIIGLLLGAVIATGAFFVYTKATTCNNSNNTQMQMPGGEPPSMENGQENSNGNSNSKGQPPEKPSGESTQNNGQENNNQNNNQTNSN